MRVRLLVDALGPNPDFKPPDPKLNLAAWLTYKHRVPFQITIPAGTELEDPWAWIHCLPNTAGQIIAEPIDDDARLMVEGESKTLGPKQRAIFNLHMTRMEAKRLHEQKAKEADAGDKAVIPDGTQETVS